MASHDGRGDRDEQYRVVTLVAGLPAAVGDVVHIWPFAVHGCVTRQGGPAYGGPRFLHDAATKAAIGQGVVDGALQPLVTNPDRVHFRPALR